MTPGEKPVPPLRRLMFVDDDSLVLEGLRRTLRPMRQEWEMAFVDSGEHALEALAREPYDAIVTDMKMPRMDGARLLEEVKKRYPEVVRMVLSGEASRDAILRSIEPTHQYLSKPCDPQELRVKLAQAFAMRDLLHNNTIRAIVSGLKSVPSLPGLYHQILDELRSEDASLERIAKIVSNDAGMTAKILQLANSAFMGVRYDISSPARAVSLIGTEMVKALVLSVHVFSQFEAEPGVAASWKDLWEHSLAVACFAQTIATQQRCSKALVDESFTAGLLHDIGKLVLLAQMPKQYDALLASSEEKPGSLADGERECFGCTHADLGAYLMSIWGLPHALIHAVAYHDRPSQTLDQQFSSLTAVHVADAIISSTSTSRIIRDTDLDDKYLQALGVNPRVQAWRELYQGKLAEAKAAQDCP